MNKEDKFIGSMLMLMGLLLMGAVGYCIGRLDKGLELKHQAIEKGYAEYNSTNGVWQWK